VPVSLGRLARGRAPYRLDRNPACVVAVPEALQQGAVGDAAVLDRRQPLVGVVAAAGTLKSFALSH